MTLSFNEVSQAWHIFPSEKVHIFIAPNGFFSGNVFILIAKTLTLVICIFSCGIWFDGSLHLPLEISFPNIILGERRREFQGRSEVRLIEPQKIRMLGVLSNISVSQV